MSAREKHVLATLENISLTFGQRTILQNISLEVYPQQVLTVIGPNGAGKSTLLRILLGLQKPQQGIVWRMPGLRIGYVPQKFHLDQLLPLTVDRFVSLNPGKRSQTEVIRILTEVGVQHLLAEAVQTLSGGELQRVLLARALLHDPHLLVLDEPGQGMDITGLGELYQLLGRIKKTHGCGVLLVSHDLHLVMATTDHVLCLNRHICCAGQPESVSRDPEYLRLFGDFRASGLALYTHHHDHKHDMHGCVVPLKQDRKSHG